MKRSRIKTDKDRAHMRLLKQTRKETQRKVFGDTVLVLNRL